MLGESCLVCGDVQKCTHASQDRIRFELYLPLFTVCVSNVEVLDTNGILFCPDCHLLQLPFYKGLEQRFLQPLDHEFPLSHTSNRVRRVKLRSQQLCNNKISLSTVTAPLP